MEGTQPGLLGPPTALTRAGRPLQIQAFLGLTFPICEMPSCPASKFYESDFQAGDSCPDLPAGAQSEPGNKGARWAPLPSGALTCK